MARKPTVPWSVREALYRRSGNRCERCAVLRRTGLTVSHRQPRGMGGKREDWGDLSQWNLLCAPCHLTFVERNPRDATRDGWKVPAGLRTTIAPVKTWQGWAFLTPDGGYAWPPQAV